MAYIAFTTAEVAQDKFVTQTFTTKLKDNFDYLYSQTAGVVLPSNGSFEIDTDSNGIPDDWTRSLYPGGAGGLYTTAPAHGAKAAYFTHPGGASNGGGYLDSSYIEVSQLQSLSLFYILWCTAAGMKNEVRIRYYDKAKAYVSDVALYSSASNPTSATLYLSHFVPVATARFIKIRIVGGFTDTDVAGTAYFDSFRIVPTVNTFMIKDASVTTAKIADASVSQAKLKTSTGTTSGSLAAGANLIVTMAAYCSSPNIYGQNNYFYLKGVNTNNANQIARFTMYNNAGASQAYAVYWRYVTSSGEIYWIFILRDKVTKEVVQTWCQPDHPCFGTCKPLLIPHPFEGSYDESKHEIIVINPANEEIEQMELETIVDDETKPDKGLIEIISENYEIDEDSSPVWPSKEVTVGLPKHVKDKKTGKKILADYRFMSPDTIVEPVKKVIPKPSYIKTKKLRRKK